jgi:hypothetical protein
LWHFSQLWAFSKPDQQDTVVDPFSSVAHFLGGSLAQS